MPTFLTNASGDDAIQSGSTVTINDQFAAVDGTKHMGVRFPSVTIPQGATIASAGLRFQQLNSYTGVGNLNSTLYGQAADNAAIFTTASNDISGRSRTTATVTSIPADANPWQAAGGVNVTSIVQEIVNRGGWASGNAMAFLLIGAGSGTAQITPYFWDYFSGSVYKAELIITTAVETYEQEGFRFRNDDGSESAATWKDSQDTNISLAKNTPFRLRILVNAGNGVDPAAQQFQLEYRIKGSGGSWKKVGT